MPLQTRPEQAHHEVEFAINHDVAFQDLQGLRVVESGGARSSADVQEHGASDRGDGAQLAGA